MRNTRFSLLNSQTDLNCGHVRKFVTLSIIVTVTPYWIALTDSKILCPLHAFLVRSPCGECVPCQVISVLSNPIRWQVLDMLKTSPQDKYVRWMCQVGGEVWL